MKEIIEKFSNVNLSKVYSNVKKDKINIFNFVMNCYWNDFLLYCKRGSPSLFNDIRY